MAWFDLTFLKLLLSINSKRVSSINCKAPVIISILIGIRVFLLVARRHAEDFFLDEKFCLCASITASSSLLKGYHLSSDKFIYFHLLKKWFFPCLGAPAPLSRSHRVRAGLRWRLLVPSGGEEDECRLVTLRSARRWNLPDLVPSEWAVAQVWW